jgi:hypothetical protein
VTALTRPSEEVTLMNEYTRPAGESKELRGRKRFPFRTAAVYYRDIGWTGTIPTTRRGTKAPLAKGVTGHNGVDATDDELDALIAEFPSANIGLRLPWNIIGIDVDAYDDRLGLETLMYISRQLDCPLPTTWRSTSRAPEDGVSGIYLFRAPRGPKQVWVTDLGVGSGIEIAQFHHRFATVAPSIHNSIGLEYKWWRGPEPVVPPRPEELPELPAAWNVFLMSPREYVVRAGAELPEVTAWFSRVSGGAMCRFMSVEADREASKIRAAGILGGLHDTLIAGVTHICMSAAEGHHGLSQALNILEWEFSRASRRRNLRFEWSGAVNTAMAKAAAMEQEETDVCSIRRMLCGADTITDQKMKMCRCQLTFQSSIKILILRSLLICVSGRATAGLMNQQKNTTLVFPAMRKLRPKFNGRMSSQ